MAWIGVGVGVGVSRVFFHKSGSRDWAGRCQPVLLHFRNFGVPFAVPHPRRHFRGAGAFFLEAATVAVVSSVDDLHRDNVLWDMVVATSTQLAARFGLGIVCAGNAGGVVVRGQLLGTV